MSVAEGGFCVLRFAGRKALFNLSWRDFAAVGAVGSTCASGGLVWMREDSMIVFPIPTRIN